MRISGHTRAFAVLGHPISHTLSPVMHNAAFAALGMDAVYLPFDVEPSDLMRVLPAVRDMGFGGVNLTVPLKEIAFRGISDLDESARVLGSVNTVQFAAEGLKGFSTDGVGFVRALEEAFGATPQGLDLFILGCGGAGRAVAIASAQQGARRIVLADVDTPRCGKLAAEIAAIAPQASTETAGPDTQKWDTAALAADIVVQATPIGMKPEDKSVLTTAAFRPGQMAFDLVYNLPQTSFMRSALAAGARVVNGLGMLLHQGAASFTIWTGRPAPVDVMREALSAALYGPPVAH